MMKLLSKIQTLEAQKSLLVEVVKSKELLESKIVSSLQPKIGREFNKITIENKKQKILLETRRKLIKLAIEEKDMELSECSVEFDRTKQEYTERNEDSEQFMQN